MLSIVTVALLSLPSAVAVPPATAPKATAEAAPRRTLSALEVRGAEALAVEVQSPRLEEGELEKAVTAPRVRQALNENHLATIGVVRVARACMLGDRLVEPGRYLLGARFTPGADLELTLVEAAGAPTVRIPLRSAPSGAHVPQLSVAFLAGPEIDAFDLEVRFGAYRGLAPLTFAAEEVVSGMNNLAWELLNAADAQATARVDALRLARQANDLTGGTVPGILDTLALAQFENGAVADAIETQRLALATAALEDGPTKAELEAQLDRFRRAAGTGN